MYYCPTCEPEGGNPTQGPVPSVAYCEGHAGRQPCPHCPALPGQRHYVNCPNADATPDEPPADSGDLRRWIRRRRVERAGQPA